MILPRHLPFGLCALVLCGLLAGCTSVPVTGRKALNMVSDEELVKTSAAEFEDMKKTLRISRDPAFKARLEEVGSRIADVVFWDMPNADWEFVVFESPGEVNAFAMAGGKVGVFSGAFDVAATDDELAVIIAHEIAHVTAKHVHEMLSQQMLIQGGGIGLSVATGIGYGALTEAAVSSLYRMGSGMIGLSFNRDKESEADHIGLIYMARAGYNPRAATGLWEKIDQLSSGKSVPPEWLSSHPSHEDRLLHLYGWMREAEAIYMKAKAQR
ncbi:MAG: M48 family metallopeptidase [Opitutaceae bacterium]